MPKHESIYKIFAERRAHQKLAAVSYLLCTKRNHIARSRKRDVRSVIPGSG